MGTLFAEHGFGRGVPQRHDFWQIATELRCLFDIRQRLRVPVSFVVLLGALRQRSHQPTDQALTAAMGANIALLRQFVCLIEPAIAQRNFSLSDAKDQHDVTSAGPLRRGLREYSEANRPLYAVAHGSEWHCRMAPRAAARNRSRSRIIASREISRFSCDVELEMERVMVGTTTGFLG
jgi:hypothetical protein